MQIDNEDMNGALLYSNSPSLYFGDSIFAPIFYKKIILTVLKKGPIIYLFILR